MNLTEMGKAAAAAKYEVQKMSASAKNAALLAVADALTGNCGRILEANGRDVSRAQENGMHPGMVDRLRLTEARVEAMAEGLRQIGRACGSAGRGTGSVYPSQRSGNRETPGAAGSHWNHL